MTICALCSAPFEAHTSYGICSACFSKDTLREYDRLQSAIAYAVRHDLPASLTLPAWLTILSDFNGKCAYCQVQWYGCLEIVNEQDGLVAGNVVPICRACQQHKRATWGEAVKRVQAYLNGTLTQDPLIEMDIPMVL